jgi:CBS domain-containing protein
MGRHSFSPYQIDERLPDLTPLNELKVGDVMSGSPDTVDAGLGLEGCATAMLRNNRRWAPVVEGGSYVGLVGLPDMARIPVAQWPQASVRDVARTDVETASIGDDLASAVARLRASGSGAMAVLEDGRIVGVVTLRDVLNVEMLLDHLTEDRRQHDRRSPSGRLLGRAADLGPLGWRLSRSPRATDLGRPPGSSARD